MIVLTDYDLIKNQAIKIITKIPVQILQRPFHFFQFEAFDHVTHFNVVEVLDTQATFVAEFHFTNIFNTSRTSMLPTITSSTVGANRPSIASFTSLIAS